MMAGLGANVCRCCGRDLTDPDSMARGVGPECSSRLAALHRKERQQVRDGAALPLEYAEPAPPAPGPYQGVL
jgi:hypothetical protein